MYENNFTRNRKKIRIYHQQKHLTKKTMYSEDASGGFDFEASRVSTEYSYVRFKFISGQFVSMDRHLVFFELFLCM